MRRRATIHGTLTLFNSADPSCLVLRSLSQYGQCLSRKCPLQLCSYYKRLAEVHQILGRRTTTTNYPFPLTISSPTHRPLGLALSTTTLNVANATLTRTLQRSHVRYRCTSPQCIILVFAPRGPTRSCRQLTTTITQLYTTLPSIPTLPRPRTSIFARLTIRTTPIYAIQRTIFTPRRIVPTRATLNHVYTVPAISYPPTVPVIIDKRHVNPTTLGLFTQCNVGGITILG